jgi:hypothetical protein
VSSIVITVYICIYRSTIKCVDRMNDTVFKDRFGCLAWKHQVYRCISPYLLLGSLDDMGGIWWLSLNTGEQQWYWIVAPTCNVYLSSCFNLAGPAILIVVSNLDSHYVNGEWRCKLNKTHIYNILCWQARCDIAEADFSFTQYYTDFTGQCISTV